MALTSIRVAAGSRCALADHEALRARGGLVLAICEEKSTTTLSPGIAAIYCCIAGESTVSIRSDGKILRRADIHISDTHSPHELTVASRGACLVIAGSAQAWNINGRRFAIGKRPCLFPCPRHTEKVRGRVPTSCDSRPDAAEKTPLMPAVSESAPCSHTSVRCKPT